MVQSGLQQGSFEARMDEHQLMAEEATSLMKKMGWV